MKYTDRDFIKLKLKVAVYTAPLCVEKTKNAISPGMKEHSFNLSIQWVKTRVTGVSGPASDT